MQENFIENKPYSLTDLHHFFSNNIIKPSFYISLLIKKTKKYNSLVNAYIRFHQDLSFLQVKKSDLEKNSVFSDILTSIPFNIKDSFISTDFKTTFGVEDENLTYANKNSKIIDLLQKHGAILLGKTNIPAYVYDVQTFNDVIGITSNPWNLDYSAGGSTGGGAVSVIIGLVPIAIGSDFAGSIRIPAHFCGVKGYIPTHGSRYLAGHYPDIQFDETFEFIVGQIGFLSNFLDDFNLLFGILKSKPVEEFLFTCKDYYYTVTIQDEYMPVNSYVKACLEKIIKILNQENINLSFEFPSDFSFKEVGFLHVELMEYTFNKEKTKDKIKLQDLKSRKKVFSDNLNNFLENRFWILPVTPTSAIKHNLEHKPIFINENQVPYWRAMIHYTRPFNVTNNPIVTLPVGKDNLGLPISVQIIAKEGSDVQLIAFAKFLEEKIGSIGFPEGFDIK